MPTPLRTLLPSLALILVPALPWGCSTQPRTGGDSNEGGQGGAGDDGGGEGEGDGGGEPGAGEGGGGGGGGGGDVGDEADACTQDGYEDANCAEIADCATSCAGDGCADECVACGISSARNYYSALALCAATDCAGDLADTACLCTRCDDEARRCNLCGGGEGEGEGDAGVLTCSALFECLNTAGRDVRAQEECYATAGEPAKIAWANLQTCIGLTCQGDQGCAMEKCGDHFAACEADDPDVQLTCAGIEGCVQLYCLTPGGVDQACIRQCQEWMSPEATAALMPFAQCAQRSCARVPQDDPQAQQQCIEDNCAEEFEACFGVQSGEGGEEVTCGVLRACVAGCDSSRCKRACEQAAPDEVVGQHDELLDCIDGNGCADAPDPDACIALSCADEDAACKLVVVLPPCAEAFACRLACERCRDEGEDCSVGRCQRDCETAVEDDDDLDLLDAFVGCAERAECDEFDASCAVLACEIQAQECGLPPLPSEGEGEGEGEGGEGEGEGP